MLKFTLCQPFVNKVHVFICMRILHRPRPQWLHPQPLNWQSLALHLLRNCPMFISMNVFQEYRFQR